MRDGSEQINELAAALAKAQARIEGAVKDAQNPHLKSKYADLASVWCACRTPLAENGLAIAQCPEPAEAGIVLRTLLLHSSGQWIASEIRFDCDLGKPQAVGSALTYARRYGLAAMVGVCPEDDDAEAAQQARPSARDGRADGRGEVARRSQADGDGPSPAERARTRRDERWKLLSFPNWVAKAAQRFNDVYLDANRAEGLEDGEAEGPANPYEGAQHLLKFAVLMGWTEFSSEKRTTHAVNEAMAAPWKDHPEAIRDELKDYFAKKLNDRYTRLIERQKGDAWEGEIPEWKSLTNRTPDPTAN